LQAALVLLVIFLGTTLRLERYLANTSLWFDEAWPANVIIESSISDLLKPPRPGPWSLHTLPGYNALQKISCIIFGPNEFSQRLVSLLAGIATLPLVYLVARRWLSLALSTLALSLMAICEYLIHSSCQAKQYSLDVMVSLLLVLAALRFQESLFRVRRLLILAIIGILAMWFSHPGVFVVAGIGLGLFMKAALLRNMRQVVPLIVVGTCWVASFAFSYYFFSRAAIVAHPGLKKFWVAFFMPSLFTSPTEALEWTKNTILSIFRNPIGFTLPLLAALFWILGIIWFWRKDRFALALVLMPLILVLVASNLKLYPIHPNLILFMVPMFILTVVNGVKLLVKPCGKRYLIAEGVMALILLYGPTCRAVKLFKSPPDREHLRPVLQYVHKHWRNGDTVYVYYSAYPAFRYYSKWLVKFDPKSVIYGSPPQEDPKQYISEIKRIQEHRRVWLIFSHILPDEYRSFLEKMNSFGQHNMGIAIPDNGGAYAHLYLFG